MDAEERDKFADRYVIRSPCWHLMAEIDWRDIFRMRSRQIAFLARYGRQDVGRLRQTPLPLLNELARELGEMVAEENKPASEM